MEQVTLTTEMITVTRGATGNALDPGKRTTVSAGCVSARARYVPDGRSGRG
jgi:hypothetical protein